MREGFQTAGLKAGTEAEVPRLEKPLTEGPLCNTLVQKPAGAASSSSIAAE
ncbi:MAG TPA: hypothetical protein VIH87_01555 [Methylocella sp.]|jgi:hypothetical protein